MCRVAGSPQGLIFRRLHDPHDRQCLDGGLVTSLAPPVAAMLMKPRMSIANPTGKVGVSGKLGLPHHAQTRGSVSSMEPFKYSTRIIP